VIAGPRPRAVLLDVEGTTTPVSFVYDVLFPYARRHLRAYVATQLGSIEMDDAATMLADEWSGDDSRGEPVPPRRPTATDADSICDYLSLLMDRDRKSPGLKRIQGKIWEQGYLNGELRGQVFPDVPRAFTEWSAAGVAIAIYSSGSTLAQRLLFSHSTAGDLTPSIGHYFDTAVGAKRSPDSYARIVAALDRSPGELTFISDVDAELEAARDAGVGVVMCVREGNATTTSRVAPTIHSFDELRW
jgi:enolase-phosphatase E1